MVGSGSDSDGGCLSSVFTSDDDHAQLQAYVMTLVLLRGCRRVNEFFRFLLRYNLAKNIDHQ